MASANETQRALAALSDAILARVPASARRRVDIDLLPTTSSSSHNDPQLSSVTDTDDALLTEQRELERRAGDALDWALVSQALRALHAESQHDFLSSSAQLAAFDAQVQQQLTVLNANSDEGDAKAVDGQVQKIRNEVNDLLHEFQDSESHFRTVAELVAPAKRKLEQLEAREAYFQAALEVERRSQHAKEQAIQATSEALDAFQAFTDFAATLPLEYTHIRVRGSARRSFRAVGVWCGLMNLCNLSVYCVVAERG